jgi:hypothetical protein
MSRLAAALAMESGIALNTMYLIHTNGACETYAIIRYLPGDDSFIFRKRSVDLVDHTKEDFGHEAFANEGDAHRRMMSAIENER